MSYSPGNIFVSGAACFIGCNIENIIDWNLENRVYLESWNLF